MTVVSCSPQAAALVGPGQNTTSGAYESATLIYTQMGDKLFFPGPPNNSFFGSTAYVNGGLLYCGGLDDHNPYSYAMPTCYQLTPPKARWSKTSPLLKVCILISLLDMITVPRAFPLALALL